MPSHNFALFQDAIASRSQVVCTYGGLETEVCPHALGYSAKGVERVLVYQFAGSSKPALPIGGAWRCLEVANVQRPGIRDGEWHTGDHLKRPQGCVARIAYEVQV